MKLLQKMLTTISQTSVMPSNCFLNSINNTKPQNSPLNFVNVNKKLQLFIEWIQPKWRGVLCKS